MVELFANSVDPDQMLHSAVSDLGLHCLPITHLGVSGLQWVKLSYIPYDIVPNLSLGTSNWKVGPITEPMNLTTSVSGCPST